MIYKHIVTFCILSWYAGRKENLQQAVVYCDLHTDEVSAATSADLAIHTSPGPDTIHTSPVPDTYETIAASSGNIRTYINHVPAAYEVIDWPLPASTDVAICSDYTSLVPVANEIRELHIYTPLIPDISTDITT